MTPPVAGWRPAAWARNAGRHLAWRLRQARADAADRSGRPFVFRHPVAGRLVYHPGDYLCRRLLLYGDFENTEIALAVARARRGGVMVDVGANIGLYTVACARAVGRRGRVVALEPGPDTFRKLSRTCAMLGLSNVTLVRAAAGRAAGAGHLVIPASARDVHQHLAGDGSGPNHTPVPIRTIDDVCDGQIGAVGLVKIDVEGQELAVVEGASRVLANGRATLIVEISGAGGATSGTAAALWARLERTHVCSAIVGADGALRPPIASSVRCGEILNTLWEPR